MQRHDCLGLLLGEAVKLILMVVVAAGLVAYFDVTSQLTLISEQNSDAVFYSLVVGCVCYGLLLMLPFVPALELGLVLMSLYGVDGVIGAYVATVSALMLSFLIGEKCRKNSDSPKFNVSKGVADKLAGSRYSFVKRLYQKVRHRPYMSLALLLNMPGNVALGGAGGIAMMAGVSGHMQFVRYGLTVMVATSVVPLLFMLGISF